MSIGGFDTSFYLSGASSEGVAAFTLTGSAPTYATDHSSAVDSALVLASGSYLTVSGAANLPSSWFGTSFTAGAWVNCAAPTNANALSAVLELGAAGDAQGAASASALALVVGDVAPRANSGVVTTLAGGGSSTGTSAGFADGSGTSALFSSPWGLAVASSGVTYVADNANNRIRAITPAGAVTTLAGGGSSTGTAAGFADDTGTSALFSSPQGLAVLASGVVLVADAGNKRIRQITPAGVVTTLCGSASGTTAADGIGTNAVFLSLSGVAVVPVSNVLVVTDGNKVRLVSAGDSAPNSGVVTTLAGGSSAGTADGTGTSAAFSSPSGIAVVPLSVAAGGGYYILVCDTGNSAIRKVTYPGGVVTTLAGDGSRGHADGTGTSARFGDVAFIASSGSAPSGVVVVSDSSTASSYLRVVTPGGIVTTLAGAAASQAYADATGTSAAFNFPTGVAVNPLTGALVVADSVNNRIRLVALPAVLPACDSTWHHVALTYANGGAPYSLSAFVDGALVFASATTISVGTRFSTGASLRIGYSGDLSTNGGSLYAGSVGDLRIYANALTAAQVATLAAS